MDQRYIDTVRACKVLLRNLTYLEANITFGQRAELQRLFLKVQEQLDEFLEADARDDGLWVGEE